MYQREDLEKAKAILDVYMNNIHDKMFIAQNEDKAVELFRTLKALKDFDNKLSIEIKSNDSEYLKTLNKI